MENDLIINKNPKSAFSEAIKTIRTNLAFANVGGSNKVILITSSQPGEGKSFITANLAVAYAQENKKVLVIDCDLRKGRQDKIFNVKNSSTKGYSNLIVNYTEATNSFNEYTLPTSNKNIKVIPTGPTPPNPVELLGSKNNKKIIERLRCKFDVILLDCPPVLGLSDALIMTNYSDANIIVTASKQTKIENLEQTKKAFEQANAKITGVILNKVSLKDSNYYSYYNTNYYGQEE